MTHLGKLLLVLLSIFAGVSHAEEIAALAPGLSTVESNAERLPASTYQTADRPRARISIGTILRSYHYGKYDEYDINESHNGLYFNINNWSTGTFTNSLDEQSVFVTHNTRLYRDRNFVVNLVAGVANGYEGWENARGDYMPMLGASVQWSSLKVMLSYDVAAFGFEIPLN